jgi:hypothetical protein
MRRLGSLWLYRGAWKSLEDEIAEIDRLTALDLRALVREYPLRPTLRAMVMPAASG